MSYKNKTAVFFGTSIPAGTAFFEGEEYSIPTYTGRLLGMNIINEAMGCSMARRGWINAKTGIDNYGITGHAWQNAFWAMGANLKEKQDLIDNYETKWASLLGGDFVGAKGDGSEIGKPIKLSDENIESILYSSYENKLVKYLDGRCEMPDLFIFEHGHNDFDGYSDEKMSGIPSVEPADINDFDRSLYGDVMAFYVRLIYEANKDAKILFVSHYANDTQKFAKMFNAQKEAAEYNKVWFCNVADKIGWNSSKVCAKGYWENGVWVKDESKNEPITRLELALCDTIHPHSDATGSAIKREAEIIAKYIETHICL